MTLSAEGCDLVSEPDDRPVREPLLHRDRRHSGQEGPGEVAELLAADLSTAIGVDVDAGHLLRRHDGALAAVVGALVSAGPRPRQTAEELVRLWLSEGLVAKADTPTCAAPVSFDLPTLVADDAVVLDGVQLVPEVDINPLATLQNLVRTGAELVGAARSVLDLATGSMAEPIDGWVARIQARAALHRLEAEHDQVVEPVLQDVADLHAIIGSLYLPAAPRSIWADVQRAARSAAVDVLDVRARWPGIDLERAEGHFWDAFDKSACVWVDAGDQPENTLVQIVRLPTPRDPGIAALATGDRS